MRLLIDNTQEKDETITIIEYWYNRQTRDWVVQLKTKDGYQVGSADYVYRKDQAQEIVKEYQLKYPEAKVIKT
jgi:hypothetical protein